MPKTNTIEIQKYHYILPIGMSPSKFQSCREELEYALGGTIEFTTKNRVVTITLYKGQLSHNIPYTLPDQNPTGLTIPIGYSLSNELITIDMSKDTQANLLGCGYIGMGKSTLANGIMNAIHQYPPEWVRTVIIDLKRGADLSQWDTHPNKWLTAYDPDTPQLKYVLTMVKKEIDRRYNLFKKYNLHPGNIDEYRKKIGPMNYIFIVVDEFAELSSTEDGNALQNQYQRIVQTGRAAGIRNAVFLQRPTVDNISGSIKVNFPIRIAFRCVTELESRIILDSKGAEELEEVQGRAILLAFGKYQKIQCLNFNYEEAYPNEYITQEDFNPEEGLLHA